MPQWCGPTSRVSSEDFGLVGDDATDNTQRLEVLRQYLIEHDRTAVDFAAGNYRYTNFEWLHGVRNVMLRGVGAVGFRNVCKSPWDIRRVTLMANADMLTGPESIPEMGVATPYLIESADAGERTLRLLSSGPVADIQPGRPLLICGYNQYNGGWPPCLRYSEFATAASVDWNQRLITLNTPLVHSYRSNWPSQKFKTQSFGPAAIVPLQRTGSSPFQLGEHHIYDNITFLESPTGPAYTNRDGLGGLYTMGVRFLEVRNCKMAFFGPNENQWVKVTNCTIGSTELGKMVGAVEILNSSVDSIGEASAVELLIIRDTNISRFLSLAPSRLVMTGNTIKSSYLGRSISLGAFTSSTHIDKAFIANNTFVLPEGSQSGSLVIVPRPHTVTLTRPLSSGFATPTSSAWSFLGSVSLGNRVFDKSGANAVIKDIVAAGDDTEVRTAGPSLDTTGGPLSVRCVGTLIFFGNHVIGTPLKQIEDANRVEELITSEMAEEDAFHSDYVNLGRAPVPC